MSQSNKPINYRFRKNVTVDDMALGNAKRTSNSKPINAVGDAAAKDPRNRAGEARGNVIDLTNDASAVTQSPTVSGRDGSEATTVRTPEDEAASVKSANNDAFFAALKKSLVLEQSPSMSRAVPSSGNETVFIHTTYPDGTAVRTPQVYATPTAEEAKAIRRKTEQLMANRHATMINGRGRIQPNATVARSLQPKTTIAGPLQPFNNSMIAERAAIDAVAKGYMVNTLLNAPASLQLGSNVSSTKLRNLAPKVSGDKDVVLDNLDGDSTAAIKKLKDLTSSVERIIETSKASQGANISAIPELVTPEYDIAAAMNLAGDTDTDRVSRCLFLVVFPFDIPPIFLGRIALFLSYAIPYLPHGQKPSSTSQNLPTTVKVPCLRISIQYGLFLVTRLVFTTLDNHPPHLCC